MRAPNRILILHLLIIYIRLVKKEEILVLLLRLIYGLGGGSSITFLDLPHLLIIFFPLLDLSVLDFDLLDFLGVLLDLCLLEILRSDDI